MINFFTYSFFTTTNILVFFLQFLYLYLLLTDSESFFFLYVTDSESLVSDADNKLNPSPPEDSNLPLHDITCNSTVPLIGFDPHEIDDKENVGKFLYREGIEYFMWCTYDVHVLLCLLCSFGSVS